MVSTLAALPLLTHLSINDKRARVNRFEPLEPLTALQNLCISGCKVLENADPLARLTRLTWLAFYDITPRSLTLLTALTALQGFDVSQSMGDCMLFSFDWMKALPQLKVVMVRLHCTCGHS
jgi:hypothetical protein